MAKLHIWNPQCITYNEQTGWTVYPDSLGTVSILMNIKNTSTKTIKYASIFCIPYNGVMDVQRCRISGKSIDGVKFTGPLAPGAIADQQEWSGAWNNHSIKYAKLQYVFLEYMDGTSETLYPPEVSCQIPEELTFKHGCYVATAVYGSYDCPQVWTLRRYRDNILAKSWAGRAFIRTYYAISPTLIKWFGDTQWFKRTWRKRLDRMVCNLQARGIASTPYDDKYWK